MNPAFSVRYVVLCAGIFFLSTPAFAQPVPSPPPAGVWWEVSASAGGARLTCDICAPERDLGGSVGFGLGTHAANGVRVGLQGGVWSNGGQAIRESLYDLGVEAVVHPKATSGLHVVGGVGWAGYRAGDADPEPDDEQVRFDAVRLRLGVGWDLPLTSGWTAGNRLTVDAASFGSLRLVDETLARSVGLSVVRFTLFLRHR